MTKIMQDDIRALQGVEDHQHRGGAEATIKNLAKNRKVLMLVKLFYQQVLV